VYRITAKIVSYRVACNDFCPDFLYYVEKKLLTIYLILHKLQNSKKK